jgi:hypothetical protein
MALVGSFARGKSWLWFPAYVLFIEFDFFQTSYFGGLQILPWLLLGAYGVVLGAYGVVLGAYGVVLGAYGVVLVGDILVYLAACHQAGYAVAMAPAQSYLDESSHVFSLRVNWPPVAPWHQDFLYSGRNVYAYLLARYRSETFAFVSIQLYEGFSSANYEISERHVDPAVRVMHPMTV